MTRKDHKLIADAIKSAFDQNSFPYEKGCTRGQLVQEVARVLATENPNFDKNKFIQVCA